MSVESTPSLAPILAGMAVAAAEAGASLAAAARRRPAATLGEFMQCFAAVEQLAAPGLRKRLDDLLPGVEWAEELDVELPATGRRWVVDVIDGAVQYMQGLPQWCVSLSLVEDRVAVAAVLHSPALGETYSAAAGQGAHRNGVRVGPSARTDLSVALVATSQPPFGGSQPGAAAAAGRALSAVLPVVGAVRNLGPTSWQIADVASGRLDAFWEYGLDDGNLLGAGLIAREAGAIVTDVDGLSWRAGSRSFLAAPAGLHTRLLELLPS